MAMEAWLRVWVSSRPLEQRPPRAAPAELPLPWGWGEQGGLCPAELLLADQDLQGPVKTMAQGR